MALELDNETEPPCTRAVYLQMSGKAAREERQLPAGNLLLGFLEASARPLLGNGTLGEQNGLVGYAFRKQPSAPEPLRLGGGEALAGASAC